MSDVDAGLLNGWNLGLSFSLLTYLVVHLVVPAIRGRAKP